MVQVSPQGLMLTYLVAFMGGFANLCVHVYVREREKRKRDYIYYYHLWQG